MTFELKGCAKIFAINAAKNSKERESWPQCGRHISLTVTLSLEKGAKCLFFSNIFSKNLRKCADLLTTVTWLSGVTNIYIGTSQPLNLSCQIKSVNEKRQSS